MKPSLLVMGLNHRTAPIELRERLAVPAEGLGEALERIGTLPHVREAMLVSTCNRVEAYIATDELPESASSLRAFFADHARGVAMEECLYEHHDEAAVRHVFRVAASLDSMVIGEPQILGQVKEAFANARTAGTIGPALSRMLERAFSTAKRVRTETGIATGVVSVATVAVDLAEQIFGELSGRHVLVLGAGKMALSAARALALRGARLSIANRDYARAQALAKARDAEPHPLEALPLLLPHVDVLLCSTGASRYVVTREHVAAAMRVRKGRSLFLIDVAVPRNIDPRVHDIDNVYVFDVDDLEREVARALDGRGGALRAAEVILEQELTAYKADRRASAVAPTVVALRQHFLGMSRAELERSLSGKLKHLSEGDRAALGVMVDAIINKILHSPTTALRTHAGTEEGAALAGVARMLFQLPESPEAPTASPEDPPDPKARVS